MPFFRFFKRKKRYSAFDVDTIFLDNKNMPLFDRSQKEGTIEQTINRRTVSILMGISFLLIIGIGFKAVHLQLIKGSSFAKRSENNRLDAIPLFARRGVITDRNGELLVWNTLENENVKKDETLEYIPDRLYINKSGMGHILGYVSYPQKDSKGFYWRTSFVGRDGVEKLYDKELTGVNGARLVEVDVAGNVLSTNLAEDPVPGQKVVLTIDSRMSDAMYRSMVTLSSNMGYRGGAGIIMDVNSGDILTMSSFPEYNSNTLSKAENKSVINSYFSDTRSIFLNRVFQGSYAPGSIIKPFVAIQALYKGVITPEVNILSTGSMSVPNPYDPKNPTIFKDWRVNGYTDMRKAIAVSSDIYFYQVGGGFGAQKGIGISGIEEVAKAFGIGEKTNIIFPGEVSGVIPSPAWKEKVFAGDAWRLGDTYHSSIGQYGWQVTPIQMARAVAGLVTGGKLPNPRITFDEKIKTEPVKNNFTPAQYAVVKEGMRMTVTDGNATVLNIPEMKLAVKTGTAQVGVGNARINSWVVGFFPYDNPKYSFAVLMEGAPSSASQSASFVMRDFFQILAQEHPEVIEYLNQ
jgi:penicillin-binding protein 2